MRLTRSHGLMLIPNDLHASSLGRAEKGRRWVSTAVVLAALTAIAGTLLSHSGAQRRAFLQLPEEQRHGLYVQTLSELEHYCGEDRPPVLQEHCRELAGFLSEFDECRGACEALVQRQFAVRPTR